jgi:hypothetical protein
LQPFDIGGLYRSRFWESTPCSPPAAGRIYPGWLWLRPPRRRPLEQAAAQGISQSCDSQRVKCFAPQGRCCDTVGLPRNKLYPPMDKAGANCSGPASDSLVASTDTKGTCLQYTAPAVAIHCQSTENSVRSNSETRRRISCRNTAAFIGWAELATSPSRCPASSPELAGDNTNNTASRE